MSDVDIVCVGFGPATAGFLHVIAKEAANIESRAVPGMPLQVICYERADDIGFAVSGVVTRRRGIDLDLSQIPMATPIRAEKVVWLRNATAAMELPYIPPFLSKHGGYIL